MKLKLCLEGTRQEVITQIDEFKTVLATSLDEQPPAAARKRKPKPEKEAEEEEEEEEEEESEIEAEEESEEEAEEEEETEAEEEEEEKAPAGPSKDKLREALKTYAAKGKKFKDKAMSLLGKYEVDHIDDLPKKFYGELLKALK